LTEVTIHIIIMPAYWPTGDWL